MRYYLVEQDKAFTDSPYLKNWFNEIDVNSIKKGLYWKIPSRTFLDVYPNEHIQFTDIILSPFPLISKTVKETIELFEKEIIYKEVVLRDSKYNNLSTYYLPFLDRLNCSHEDSEFNTDRSKIHKLILDTSKIINRPIFILDDMEKYFLIVKIDLLEAILRRGATGIHVSSIENKKGDELDG